MGKYLRHLKDLYNKGGDDNFLIIADDPYFIQLGCAKKSPSLYIDAVSNSHLQEADHLSDEQIQKLMDLGFEVQPRSGDYTIDKEFGLDKFAEIEEFITSVVEIYGMNSNKLDFEINLE